MENWRTRISAEAERMKQEEAAHSASETVIATSKEAERLARHADINRIAGLLGIEAMLQSLNGDVWRGMGKIGREENYDVSLQETGDTEERYLGAEDRYFP
ncbi:MAG: hypothetical protein M1444_04390, partial [Patescibacteria group bacterium]|nr:hypothetical protein [Patescibacteria group bacterium]